MTDRAEKSTTSPQTDDGREEMAMNAGKRWEGREEGSEQERYRGRGNGFPAFSSLPSLPSPATSAV